MESHTNGSGPLRTVLKKAQREAAQHDCRLTLADLTVLSTQHDPYRFDTPVGNRNGKWFAEVVGRLLPDGVIHLRGLHYRIVAAADVIRPDNGMPYTNTDEAWTFLCEKASKAGRYLGYVDFERIIDERNAPAEIYVQPLQDTLKKLSTGLSVEIPELELPEFWCRIRERQLYHLCFIGEKVSLKAVLQPIAEKTQGELLLPTGEITDTQIAELAARAVEDTRSTVVLYFSDFDPSGHQMPISVARKLQALRDLKYHSLNIQVIPVALTLTQVRELSLPSTPLKETERRADNWRRVMRHEQTEIDALAALDPETLSEIAWHAVKPFYDDTLADRIETLEAEWSREANRILRSHPAYSDMCQRLRNAFAAVQGAATSFHEVQERVRVTLSAIQTPELGEPYAWPRVEAPEPLFTTEEDYVTPTRQLINHKNLTDLVNNSKQD
jgi:hypothetical protein